MGKKIQAAAYNGARTVYEKNSRDIFFFQNWILLIKAAEFWMQDHGRSENLESGA